ncbi:hypothetical protein RHS01_03430 [Rhizoctonia solani]|uniref:Phosphatidate phosphatase APP1 catalytic domain-containing protein n=1 Tax=Rhizoctonia solani TaxID=456999 RepID=A0A8H7M6U4_9AGAM|nr:hypothetical protein RHS01_03430 [Rhizoctonia solani]
MNYLYSRPENPRAGSASGSMTGGWRNAALARFAKVRDYVASSEVPKSAYAAVSNRVAAYRNGFDPVTGEKRQTWEEWAREKRQRRREEQRGAEKLALFPGWAVRRYPNEGSLVSMKHDEVQRFAVDVFVSGFASSLRTPTKQPISKGIYEIGTRLPPPPEDILGGPGTESPLAQSPNPSTDDLNEELERMGIILPPRPDEITKETEAKALESRTKPKVKTTQDSRIVDYGSNDASNLSTTSNPTLSISGLRPQSPPLPHRSPTIITQTPSPGTSPIKNIRSNTVGSISSMLSVNSTRSNTDVGSIHPDMDIGILRQLHANLDERLQPFWSSKLDNRTVRIKLYAQPYSSRRTQDSTPIQVVHVKTTPQGYFSHKFRLTFEDLSDYTFHAHAELLPAVYPSDLSTAGAEASREIEVGDATVRAETELPLTARACSSHLGRVQGSVKLKSYGGRNLFQGLWGESAADRKRGNVMEILDNFSQSKFILVGDSGEQDLELYSALAEERPDQILAIFIRDVTPPTPPATAPSSPTLGPTDDNIIKKKGSTSSLRSIRSLAGGGKIAKEPPGKIQTPALMKNPTTISQSSQPSTPKRSGSRSVTDPQGLLLAQLLLTRPVPPTPPPYIRSPPTNQGIELDPAGALVSAAATAGTGHSADATVDTTRAGILAKKEALRLRTDAARRRIPNGVIFRVFKEPSECEDDANRVIDSLESAST